MPYVKTNVDYADCTVCQFSGGVTTHAQQYYATIDRNKTAIDPLILKLVVGDCLRTPSIVLRFIEIPQSVVGRFSVVGGIKEECKTFIRRS